MVNSKVLVLRLAGAAVAAALIVACQREEPSKLPDAEAVRQIGRAVLGSSEKAAAAQVREVSTSAWGGVSAALLAFRKEVASLASATEAGPETGDQAVSTLIAAIEKAKAQYEDSGTEAPGVPHIWREQLRASGIGRFDATLNEVRTWPGLAPAAQLSAAKDLQLRIGLRPLVSPDAIAQDSTINITTRHR